MGNLDRYIEKRDFTRTPEPQGGHAIQGLAPRYSMQMHDATRLHFDLRLEWEGVLLSWAVTRGPSFHSDEKRLAVRTEDHPVDYLDFEGTIPKDSYGAGTVMLWDFGYWQPLDDVTKGLKKGHVHMALHGERLTGRWNLIRMKGGKAGDDRRENWLLIKEEDEAEGAADPVRRYRTSVTTGRDLRAIAAGREDQPRGAAHSGANPKFRKPQLATLVDDGDRYLDPGPDRWSELKFDGYRALVSVGKGGVRIHTRSGQDWSEKFAPLLPPFDALDCDSALIDGEIVPGAGLTGFGTLQKAIKAGGPFTYMAFDLLSLDGADLTGKPLRERRKSLEKLMKGAVSLGAVQLSPVIRGDAAGPFDAVCGAGGEGLISKRVDAPYATRRTKDWLKIKCEHRAEFVIVGWQKSDKRGRPFASLLMASSENEELVYRGKVGTGWDGDAMDEVAAAMAPLERKTAPLDIPKGEARGVVWLTPKLVAEVKYGEITGEGHLRHSVFEGLREDKRVEEVSMIAETGRIDVAGISVSSGDRIVFQKPKVTKRDIAEYYAAVADRLLDTAADRPLSLVRLPEGLEGERFFQKHAGKGFPDALKTVTIEESDGDTGEYMYVTDAAGLVGAAQMGTIEFHVWGARRDRLDRPDRMVFDLDPDEGLGFAEVKRAATDLRDMLDDLGLPSAPMVTGGKGVHVVVPLRRVAGWDTVKLFAKTLAHHCEEAEPKRFTATMSKAKRKGRIFIDWLRNERGATAIAPFSVRARPGAPVAVPVSWDELQRLRRADGFTMKTALDRAHGDGALPAAGSLTDKVVERLEALISG